MELVHSIVFYYLFHGLIKITLSVLANKLFKRGLKNILRTQRLAWMSLWCLNQQFMYVNVVHDADCSEMCSALLPCFFPYLP